MIKTIPKKGKCKKAKWLSEEALQRAVNRREATGKGEKERYTHLCMKCSLEISNFLEEISRLSHSIASISSYWLLRKATHFASRPILFNVAQLLCQYISTGEIWEEYIRLVIVIPLVGVGCREVKRWKMWTATSYFNKSKERVGLWMNFSFWRSLVLLWKKH